VLSRLQPERTKLVQMLFFQLHSTGNDLVISRKELSQIFLKLPKRQFPHLPITVLPALRLGRQTSA